MRSALQSLQDCGRTLWLDHRRRSLIAFGELKRLIEEHGLGGLASNWTMKEPDSSKVGS